MPVATDSTALLTGPLLLGCLFNWGLFGTLVVQQYDYLNAYRNTDRALIRFMVYFVFALELVQTWFVTNSALVILVLRWGTPTLSRTIPWTSVAMPLLVSIVALAVRIYFVWRIRSLKRATITEASCAIIVIAALLELSASIAIVVQNIWVQHTTAQFNAATLVHMAYFAGGFASDVIIAVNMGFLLWKTRITLQTNVIHATAVYIVETGIVTALAAVAQLVLFVRWNHNGFLHVAIRFVMGRLYANVLLAVLNQRPVPMPNPEHVDGGRSVPMHHLDDLSVATDGLAVTNQTEPHTRSLAPSSTEMHKLSSQDVSSEDLAIAQKAP